MTAFQSSNFMRRTRVSRVMPALLMSLPPLAALARAQTNSVVQHWSILRAQQMMPMNTEKIRCHPPTGSLAQREQSQKSRNRGTHAEMGSSKDSVIVLNIAVTSSGLDVSHCTIVKKCENRPSCEPMNMNLCTRSEAPLPQQHDKNGLRQTLTARDLTPMPSISLATASAASFEPA